MALLERLLKIDKDEKRHLNLETFFSDVDWFIRGRLTSEEIEKKYDFTSEDQEEWYALSSKAPSAKDRDARLMYFYGIRGKINQAINTGATVAQLCETLHINYNPTPKEKAETEAEPQAEVEPEVEPKPVAKPKSRKAKEA